MWGPLDRPGKQCKRQQHLELEAHKDAECWVLQISLLSMCVIVNISGGRATLRPLMGQSNPVSNSGQADIFGSLPAEHEDILSSSPQQVEGSTASKHGGSSEPPWLIAFDWLMRHDLEKEHVGIGRSLS